MPSSAPILQLQDTAIPLRGHVSWVFSTFTVNAWGFLFGVWVDIFSGNPFKWMTVRKELSALVVSKTAFIVGENDQWWVLQLVYSITGMWSACTNCSESWGGLQVACWCTLTRRTVLYICWHWNSSTNYNETELGAHKSLESRGSFKQKRKTRMTWNSWSTQSVCNSNLRLTNNHG